MGSPSRLLGLKPSSQSLLDYIHNLSSLTVLPEVKVYSDVVYYNYYPLGLSLLFKPIQGYTPKTGSSPNEECLILDSLDFYNIPDVDHSKRKAETAFTTHPVSPLTLQLSSEIKDKDGKVVSRPPSFDVTRETTGKEFVECLGEPDRKGGGSGPSSGSIGIWCEWSKDGILVEFGGVEATGPQAWERGKDAIWKVITVFKP